ncbi:MAG: tRNA epoxyqueuosine(34) reductase QueG [Candidatus Hydrogenedentes bacterium]|nr:tRNA epoxyqueuosine(34) reductase QueG [Candidatus Hydrogenedentota bacterium]
MTPTERAKALKREAATLHFDVCGIAAADPADPQDLLGQWLAQGCHADMNWLAATKEIRQDVQRKLPGTRSVVVVARNYYAPPPRANSDYTDAACPTGRVSRYAWGRDYHRALLKPLRKLGRFVAALEPHARVYCCIDSGPVLEKFWAARAGVGWIGKNSLVLRRDLGSWFFLGVILATVELASDRPMPDQCGSCTLCLEACPTQAIVAPRTVDARRCISYHTIENRNEIPPELQGHFADWIFGCDICQDVCPYNRKVPYTTETDFHARPNQARLDLDELAATDEETFRNRFTGTPILRAKHRGIQRNAAIARENHAGKSEEGRGGTVKLA